MRSSLSVRAAETSLLVIQLLSSYASGMDEGGIVASHDSSHSEHHHHLAVVVAATSNLDKKHTDLTLGGDYHFRLSSRWAVGGFGEAVFAEHTEYLFGVPFYFFPTGSFWLRAGPGVELETESEGSHSRSSDNEGHTTRKAKFLFRFGAGYNFEVGGLTISPSLDFDIVRNANALVWGVGIGKSF